MPQVAQALGAVVLVLGLPGQAMAQGRMPLALPGDAMSGAPVVVELYTAQGCAACPPADALLAELALRPDVIALALHVDYWDYIGWRDSFADPEHAERQKRYARRHGHSTIYTPQMVINGADIMEGFQTMRVLDAIGAHHAQRRTVTLTLTRAGSGMMEIGLRAIESGTPDVAMSARVANRPAAGRTGGLPQTHDRPPYVLHLVRYLPAARVAILEGENAGRSMQYVNIVTDWQTIANWDRRAPLAMSVRLDGPDSAVVIVQEAGQGAILAAARLP